MADDFTSDYRLIFEERDNYLYVFVAGPKDSAEVSIRFWTEIHKKTTALGTQKLLVEEDFPNQISTIDMFESANFVCETFRGKIKIAHVDARLSHIDLNSFGETVAVNRGLDAAVFDNIEDAIKWLNEEE